MSKSEETTSGIVPLNPIRVETALSRYPVHRIAKQGEIGIDIRERNQNGEVSIRWEVNHVPKYGQPGPLAYKLDTLIINRRIEEAGRPIPRLIRLGSLHEICRELGISEGKNILSVKKALYQNASTFIAAKIRYRQSNGTEQTLETGFTRYQVIFTGEKLPDGRTADAVYLVLHDAFIQVINGAMTRPLDYDYLKSLAAAPQRFYELLSYQMYAAIKNDRPRAKLVYSEFCKYAPLTRHVDWTFASRQMAKIHAPHKKSGYIGKIDYEPTVDAEGLPDWIMLYQPGPKAKGEFRAFTKRGGPVVLEMEPFTAETPRSLPARVSKPSPLAAELIGHGVNDAVARQLAAEYDEDKIRQQLEIVDWLAEKKPGKIAEPGAYLVAAIKNGHAAPKGFVARAEREAKKAKVQAEDEERRLKREAAALERQERQAVADYWQSLTPRQQAELQTAADNALGDPQLMAREEGPLKKLGQNVRRVEYIRQRLKP